MSDIWPRRLLLVAAAWNILGGAGALFVPVKHFAQLFTASLSLNEPLQLFFIRCTWINVILSVASSGLFAVAMLTEALVLVPYWRSLRLAEFLA